MGIVGGWIAGKSTGSVVTQHRVASVAVTSNARTLAAPTRVSGAGEVLSLVRLGHARTTTQLAERMGLARSTVKERVALLVKHGLLRESPAVPGGIRGRPAMVLEFNAQAGLALAVQLGISGARLAVTDLDGTVLVSETVDLDLQTGPAAVLAEIVARLGDMLSQLGESSGRVHGLGIGLPSRIDLSTQPQSTAQSPGSWDPADVRPQLANSIGVPVFVDHDVSMLAYGEYHARRSGAEVLLCVKAGTVFGCGVVVNGVIVTGGESLAGEIGHTRVGDAVTPCVCGNAGCLNAVSGGAALMRQLESSGLGAHSTRALAELANAGDIAAGQAIRQAGRDLGLVLASAVNLLNPEVISVWGYLADAGEHLFAGIAESVSRFAAPGAARSVRIERATMGNDAGIYGAAMLVVKHALEPATVDEYFVSQG